MVEVLELLASDSPSQDRSASTTTSSVTTDSHNSSITGSNHSSVSGDTNHGDNGDVQGTLLDVGDQTRSGSSHLVTLPSSGDNFEEKYPAGYRTDEEQEQATLGFVQRMQDSMYAPLVSMLSCCLR
ncbi:hypothetical protein F441_01834 [Phytophthora nicotianae CJ01A1]|uniref:Uncharacterized protein n=5 Tax=Phytophthora nicotianae TaxID=4792 RepID=V9FWK8_PHYNI|nr:hypothetical protein F443_01873 [Phytophthora nicotianae P1569]ETK95255.1 hypothetical protein L915_01796 [Phytophthora nicotianae]ETO84173.1 hypothetical protein F444_01877 [Phytophthora nicotianae P1976]ETP25251.1 hypothetical protein F441_01834 [Phytophthora nicotianae CJ01A1]ETP53300.1 hypothetical protein F442_01812 [Phytophthora nicotianae P10297]